MNASHTEEEHLDGWTFRWIFISSTYLHCTTQTVHMDQPAHLQTVRTKGWLFLLWYNRSKLYWFCLIASTCSNIHSKQLQGIFHFVLTLATPVDTRGTAPKWRLQIINTLIGLAQAFVSEPKYYIVKNIIKQYVTQMKHLFIFLSGCKAMR